MKKIFTKIERIIPIAIILIAWIIGSQYIQPIFLPKPLKVLESFGTLIENGMLEKSAIASFTRISIATLISASIAIPIGLIVSNYKVADNLITPVTGFMRFMPVTAFYPLLIAWVGIDEKMKITFLVMATIFYFLPTVILCLKEVNQDLIDTGYTMGMTKLQIMLRVMLPAGLPSICESFIMMYGIGWTYVIIAEVINATSGLGHIINLGAARGRTDLVFVALFTILVISYFFDMAGNALIKKIFKWKYARAVQS